jgi:hypothetical protein
MSRSLGFDRLDGLATALLNGALDDFTQADLSNVDLADVDLTGVRWSMTTTQWPSNRYKDAVLQRSRQITPGSSIYVVISPLDPAPEDAYA